MINTMIGMPQGLEWLVILAIVVLVFGAAKLPDLARSSGQALRIFKTETKGLRDDEKAESETTEAQREIEARNEAQAVDQRTETSGEVLRERRDDTTA
ncbi:Sec-independent protein translocase subunit TatA [Nocardioides pinisoli]|nr:Sec-independent protein translocase subunit TatA [Nocardioides pinisoli]